MLLLDLGNSSVKCQWWQTNQLQSSFSCRFKPGWSRQFSAYLQRIEATSCYFSAVLDTRLEHELNACLKLVFEDSAIHKLSSLASSHGVVNGYQTPTALGVDRWMALLGTAARVKKDTLIVDAGSAITLDLLRADGQHLGGAILPGFNTTIDRFKQIMRTANFDHEDISSTDKPGCSTEACINIDYESTSEAVLGKLIGDWMKLLQRDAVLVASGGDAGLVRTLEGHRLLVMPDLVFRGMRRQLENR